MDALRRLLELAPERGLISRNPIQGRGLKLRERPKKPTLPTRNELQKLFAEVEKGSGQGGWRREIADFLRFLAYSGCRLNEAKAVTRAEVNFEKDFLHVRGSKTAATDRFLPLNERLRVLLVRFRARREATATEAIDGKPFVKPPQRCWQ